MDRKIDIVDGILIIDDKKSFLLSADYPYYRDSRRNWDLRLKKIRDMGVDTVTCYIPWRHHRAKIRFLIFQEKRKKIEILLIL